MDKIYEVTMEHYRHGESSYGAFSSKEIAEQAAEHAAIHFRDPGCYVKNQEGKYAWVNEVPIYTGLAAWLKHHSA